MALSSCSADDGWSLLSKLRASIGSETEPNGSTATAMPIGNQARLRGFLLPQGEADYFSFTAAAGDRVYFATMTAASSTNSTDTVISLIDRNGTSVMETDDDNGTFSSISSSIAGATLQQAGTYFVQVEGYFGDEVWPYDLYFRRQGVPSAPEVEPNNTTGTAQSFPASGFVDGSLSSANDIDYYSVALNAGDTLFISLDLQPVRTGGVTAGRLGIAPLAAWSLLADDSGQTDATPSEAMFMTAKATGVHTFFVDTGGSTATGNYRLAVTVFPRDQVGSVCTTYTSTDVPKAIPTGPGQVTSVLTVPGSRTVADLSVILAMTHSNPQDLDVRLTAPGGNTVVLFDDIGPGIPSNVDITLDQAAGIPIDLFTTTGMALQPAASYRLHWFNGQPAGGTWTLTIDDDLLSNGGTLTGFGLRICEPAPPPTCATGGTPIPFVSFDFESGAGGFTHSGTADSWALGTPAATAAPITSCNGGTQCWKTNLTGRYPPSSSQNLVSPPINLTSASAPILLSWAMKYQMDVGFNDHAWAEIQNSDGGSPRRVWEFRDRGMTGAVGNPEVTVLEAAGWGVTTADVSAYAGRTVRLVFHVDSDTSNEQAGLAIDDISLNACSPTPCGNGTIDTGEQCDHGPATGGPGDCCVAGTCQFAAATLTCRASADPCDVAETCTGSSGVCPTNGGAPDGTSCDEGDLCTTSDTCQNGLCTSGTPVQCPPADQCHTVGTCDPASGACSSPPPVGNGTLCNDGNACTATDTCQNGTCTAGSPTICNDNNACTADTCNPATGSCEYSGPPTCAPDAGGGGDGGQGDGGQGGCGCAAPAGGGGGSQWAAILLVGVLLTAVRRRFAPALPRRR